MTKLVHIVRALGLAGVLGVLAVLALAGGAAGAAGGTTISAGDVEVPAGGSATVNVDGHADAPGVGAYTLDVSYDPSVAHLTACQPKSGGLCNPGRDPNTVRIAGFSLVGLTGDFTFAELTFEAVGNTGSHGAVTVHVTTLADGNAEDITNPVVNGGSVTVVDQAPPPPSFGPGDVDCDGDVDSVDALGVLSHTAGISTPDCIDTGDVNCDGAVDSKDALDILRFVAFGATATDGCPPMGTA